MAPRAAVSPSKAYRVIACPGSVRLCAGVPPKKSVYADEGTAAHKLAETCLREGQDAAQHIGNVVSVEDLYFPVTPEMAGHVQAYLDEVRRMQTLIGGRLYVEEKVSLDALVPGLKGTCDAAIVEPFGRGVVLDLKYGVGVVVDPFWNEQLMLYALGLALKHELESVVMIVVQPRANPDETLAPNWRQFELTTGQLTNWVKEKLIPALELAATPDAPLAMGRHCRFCDARPTCPEHRRQVFEAAQVAFDDEVVPVEAAPTLPAPNTLTPAQLGRIVAVMRAVSGWAAEVEKTLWQGLESGAMSPEETGFKLVSGRASRKWADENAALSACFALIQGQAYEDPKFKSVAQMEKTFKASGKDFGKIQDLVAVSRGVSMVALGDKRPAIEPAAKQFETYTDAESGVEDF